MLLHIERLIQQLINNKLKTISKLKDKEAQRNSMLLDPKRIFLWVFHKTEQYNSEVNRVNVLAFTNSLLPRFTLNSVPQVNKEQPSM